MRLPVVRFGQDSGSCGSDSAFYISGSDISRQRLLSHAQAMAGHLTGSATYCINLCNCRYQFTLGFSAALLAGMTSLLPANRQTQTVTSVLEGYSDALVLHDKALEPDLISALQERGIPIVDITAIDLGLTANNAELPQISAEHCAAVVFTSGSTGEPCAIAKPWRTLVGTTELLQQRFLQDVIGSSIVATVPPQHMYGLESTVMMSLYGHYTVESSHPFFPADVVQALARVPAPRILVTTPVHMKALLQSDVELPSIDTVISATAPLSAAIAQQAESKWNCVVKEIYGCSEAGSLASRRTAAESEWWLLDGIRLEGVGDAVHVVAPHLPEAVPLHDRIELVSASHFRLLGRSDDMLNIAGKRASLTQLTAQLQAVDGVIDGIFFLRDEGRDEIQRVAALVVSDRSEQEINGVLSGLLDPAFMPRPLRKVSAIPRNALGKVPREQLLLALQTGESTK